MHTTLLYGWITQWNIYAWMTWDLGEKREILVIIMIIFGGFENITIWRRFTLAILSNIIRRKWVDFSFYSTWIQDMIINTTWGYTSGWNAWMQDMIIAITTWGYTPGWNAWMILLLEAIPQGGMHASLLSPPFPQETNVFSWKFVLFVLHILETWYTVSPVPRLQIDLPGMWLGRFLKVDTWVCGCKTQGLRAFWGWFWRMAKSIFSPYIQDKWHIYAKWRHMTFLSDMRHLCRWNSILLFWQFSVFWWTWLERSIWSFLDLYLFYCFNRCFLWTSNFVWNYLFYRMQCCKGDSMT